MLGLLRWLFDSLVERRVAPTAVVVRRWRVAARFGDRRGKPAARRRRANVVVVVAGCWIWAGVVNALSDKYVCCLQAHTAFAGSGLDVPACDTSEPLCSASGVGRGSGYARLAFSRLYTSPFIDLRISVCTDSSIFVCRISSDISCARRRRALCISSSAEGMCSMTWAAGLAAVMRATHVSATGSAKMTSIRSLWATGSIGGAHSERPLGLGAARCS